MFHPALILLTSCSLFAHSLVRVGLPQPATLDLRKAEALLLPPEDSRDPALIKAAHEAWSRLVLPLKGAPSVRIQLPRDERRLPLLLAANQALRAQTLEQEVLLAWDPEAPPILNDGAWGALQGGVLLPEDLGEDPGRWPDHLTTGQELLPGRPWFLWVPSDPGDLAARLLGDGGRLIVPDGGPSALLARQVRPGFTEVESERGDLILRNPSTQEERRWRMVGGQWQSVEATKETNHVSVTAKAIYDVGSLLARMRAELARQWMTLRTLEALVSIDLHMQSPSDGMGMDLGLRLRHFSSAGEPDESLQLDVLVNGVRAKFHGKASLPIFEASASAALPVSLTLTERYRYSDAGEESGSRRIRFEPMDGDSKVYSGELLVEPSSGRILEERSRRSGMSGTVKSETRTVTYGEPSPGVWRPVRVEGYERWLVSGGPVTVQRQVTYSDFKVNDPGFLEARQAARTSSGTMFQQTLEGTRYFTKQPDGARKVEEKLNNAGFGLGGILLMDPTSDTPIAPLAALAYYNFNAFDKGIRVNAMTAIVVNQAEIGVPDLFWGVDLSAGASVSFLKRTHRPVKEGKLQEKDGVGMITQQADISLARDLGAGLRFAIQGLFKHNRYSEPSERKYRTPGFTLPESGWDRGTQGTLSWQNHGFLLELRKGEGRRPHATYGTSGDPQYVPDGGRYRWWEARTAYDHDLGKGKWLNVAAGHMAGDGFDRFKAFAVDVGGIRSDAMAADRMVYGKVGFVIPTGQALRLTLRLDHAEMRSLEDGKFYGFTGLGAAGDLPGFWWFTTVRVDLGFGLRSDIPGVRGVNGSVTLLRIF